MAYNRVTGKDVTLTVNNGTSSITSNWTDFSLEVTSTKAEATSADSTVVQRVTKQRDAKITLKGFDTELSAGLSYVEVLAMQGLSLTALTFVDKAGTPVNKLSANFLTNFPAADWRVDDVSASWNEDPSQWTMSLTPNNLDADMTTL